EAGLRRSETGCSILALWERYRRHDDRVSPELPLVIFLCGGQDGPLTPTAHCFPEHQLQAIRDGQRLDMMSPLGINGAAGTASRIDAFHELSEVFFAARHSFVRGALQPREHHLELEVLGENVHRIPMCKPIQQVEEPLENAGTLERLRALRVRREPDR